MSLPATRNAPSTESDPSSRSVGGGRYSILSALSQGPRAQISLGVAEGAASLDQMVVIKQFHPLAAATGWTQLVPELELASCLDCPDVLRTLDVALQPEACFLVQRYVEGATLRACLDWANTTHTRLPNAAVARILVAILGAVKQADQAAGSAGQRALVHAPIAADDVFVGCDGQVKLLGFKGRRAEALEGRSGARVAIDALLAQHLTPELSAVLARFARARCARAPEESGAILQALQRWRSQELVSDGRAELSRMLRHVERRERARQALRAARAFSSLSGPRSHADEVLAAESAPPQSGFRRIGDQLSISNWSGRR